MPNHADKILNAVTNSLTIYYFKIIELRRQTGAPEHLLHSPLVHPELGLLGNLVNEGRLASYLMILHDSSCSKQRSNTVLEVPPPVDLTAPKREPLTYSLIQPASIQTLI